MYILQALCALAVALLFPDVEADTTLEKSIGSAPVKDSQIKLYEVRCDKWPCYIPDIHLQGVSGGLKLKAVSASTTICTKEGNIDTCNDVLKDIDEKVFHIYLKADPTFNGGKLIVKIGWQPASIKEVNHKDANDKEVLARNFAYINFGNQEVTFPNLLTQYKISCKGNCNNVRITGIGEKIVVAAAKDPVLVKDGAGCQNCFCVKRGAGNSKFCNGDNLGLDRFYVTLIPDPKVKDVYAYIEGGNFESVTEYNIRGNIFGSFITSDKSKPGKVYRVNGPIQSQLTVDLEVDFKADLSHKTFHIDVLTDAEVKAVLATKVKADFTGINRGSCTSCTCTNRNACKSFSMNIETWKWYTIPTNFKVRVTLEASSSRFPAYVRVSGQKFRNLRLVRTTG